MSPPVQPFANSAAARLLIDVRHTRHESVEFPGNLFFNDLCGQLIREEAILLAGAQGSNKSTLTRQLTLDHVSQGNRALMVLTEEVFDGSDATTDSNAAKRVLDRHGGRIAVVMLSAAINAAVEITRQEGGGS